MQDVQNNINQKQENKLIPCELKSSSHSYKHLLCLDKSIFL